MCVSNVNADNCELVGDRRRRKNAQMPDDSRRKRRAEKRRDNHAAHILIGWVIIYAGERGTHISERIWMRFARARCDEHAICMPHAQKYDKCARICALSHLPVAVNEGLLLGRSLSLRSRGSHANIISHQHGWDCRSPSPGWIMMMTCMQPCMQTQRRGPIQHKIAITIAHSERNQLNGMTSAQQQ